MAALLRVVIPLVFSSYLLLSCVPGGAVPSAQSPYDWSPKGRCHLQQTPRLLWSGNVAGERITQLQLIVWTEEPQETEHNCVNSRRKCTLAQHKGRNYTTHLTLPPWTALILLILIPSLWQIYSDYGYFTRLEIRHSHVIFNTRKIWIIWSGFQQRIRSELASVDKKLK